jgi:hypothetical protein
MDLLEKAVDIFVSLSFFLLDFLELMIRRLKGHVERCCIQQPLPILSPG